MAKLDKMTTIYRNLKTGMYIVQPCTIGPVAATEFGDPTVIQPSEFEYKVASAVLENLENSERTGTTRLGQFSEMTKNRKNF
jgi:hypothetical protein